MLYMCRHLSSMSFVRSTTSSLAKIRPSCRPFARTPAPHQALQTVCVWWGGGGGWKGNATQPTYHQEFKISFHLAHSLSFINSLHTHLSHHIHRARYISYTPYLSIKSLGQGARSMYSTVCACMLHPVVGIYDLNKPLYDLLSGHWGTVERADSSHCASAVAVQHPRQISTLRLVPPTSSVFGTPTLALVLGGLHLNLLPVSVSDSTGSLLRWWIECV
ncbi:hypothetical protein BO86DRAFT_30523 [Aspergillus japonicus CBS 114.51]|uniref:Uncharacterized protein n=1 Tax=Aspergillus japonicus CBS 114.51 TaxID=1448312 RepID=A0A8T8WJP3_ASPJA|nr:hypothetical protein BO86DRAFT_30523 [Aspergillus japonicus CBS 114.51]RAH76061.1 hypothetical protein BO86DRAFT_30523 [Aspergillus japonicus CBS 114.51]